VRKPCPTVWLELSSVYPVDSLARAVFTLASLVLETIKSLARLGLVSINSLARAVFTLARLVLETIKSLARLVSIQSLTAIARPFTSFRTCLARPKTAPATLLLRQLTVQPESLYALRTPTTSRDGLKTALARLLIDSGTKTVPTTMLGTVYGAT
jgi:hypothetical protein